MLFWQFWIARYLIAASFPLFSSWPCQLLPCAFSRTRCEYCKKLLGENNALVVTTETAAKSSLPLSHNVLDEGWALRSTKTSKPFSEKQRRFLEENFTIGETTGRKLDPVTVARQLRMARGSDGQRQFTPEELLTAN